MNKWLDNTLKPLELGEALIAGSVEGLNRGLQASTAAIGKLCTTGAERWQAAIRQMQVPVVNLADILRARSPLNSEPDADLTPGDVVGA